VLVHCGDCQQLHRLVQAHFHISILEFVFAVVHASGSLPFLMNHINVPYLGRVSASGESSQSSGSSIIPTSVKRARPKRKASDEDVWDYSDMKIIGTKINLCCTFFVSSSVVQN